MDPKTNVNAKTEAAENKSVPADESQRPITPDTSKNDAIPESQRPIAPEEDKRRLRAMRGPKCIPDVLRQVLGEATKDHEETPSEKLVKVAKERDILFDMVNHWKEELDEVVGRECATGKNPEDADFIREYIAALSAAKDVLTRRITTLLAQS